MKDCRRDMTINKYYNISVDREIKSTLVIEKRDASDQVSALFCRHVINQTHVDTKIHIKSISYVNVNIGD